MRIAMAGESAQARDLATAIEADLPDLAAAGEVTPGAVLAIDRAVTDLPGGVPPDAADLVSAVNLAAARALADVEVIKQTALTRVRENCRALMELDPRDTGPRAVLITEALELIGVWGLEEQHGALAAEVYLQAGNLDAIDPRPSQGTLDRALRWFVKGYRLKQDLPEGPAPDLPELGQLLQKVALDLLADCQLASVAPMTIDAAWQLRALLAAGEALEALRDAVAARQARMDLLWFYTEHRLIEAARPLIERFVDELDELTTLQRTRLALVRGDWLSQQGDASGALESLAALGDMLELTPEQRAYAVNIRGSCHILLGRFGDARADFADLYKQAQAAAAANPRDASAPIQQLVAMCHLGYIQLRRGRFDEGERWLREAESLMATQLVSSAIRRRHSEMWARGLYEGGRLEAALARYEAALKLSLEIAKEISDPESREAALGAWTSLDARVVELKLRLGDLTGGYLAAEESKARVLRELAQLHGRSLQPMAPGAADDRRLRSDHALLVQRRFELVAELEIEPDPASRLEVERQLHAVDAQIDHSRGLLEALVSKARAPGAPTPADQSLSALLGDNAREWAVVSYHISDDGCAIVIRTVDDQDQFAGGWHAEIGYDGFLALEEPWEEARSNFFGDDRADSSATALDRYLTDMYELLWAPIAPELERLGRRRVLVLPHRGLHLVPFAALGAPRHHVVDACDALCVAPGERLLAALRARPDDTDDGVMAFGLSDEDAPLMALEAALIPNWARRHCTVEIGAGANPDTLYRAGRDASLVHLACHGIWTPRNPAKSGLELAPLPPELPALFGQADGFVNLPSLLAQLSLPHCRLAVLSACESGVAKRSRADEPMSLPLAFLLAGCRAVIATLWPVRDDAALLFMSELFRMQGNPASPATSVVSAQRWLRDVTPDEAATRLQDARGPLDRISDMDAAVAEAAGALLDSQIGALQQMDRRTRPYSGAEHWAAFGCHGVPG